MTQVGTVQAINRYPVKSMQGESLGRAPFGPTGIPGDRVSGLLDVESGKVVSAKDPRRWAQLLDLRATWLEGPIEVELPDGTRLRATDDDADARLSGAVGRAVRLVSTLPEGAGYDYVWEVDGMAPDEIVEGSRNGTTADGRPMSTMPLAMMAPGTFQDVAPITLLTTASLAAMRKLHPDGDWSPDRFRSNLVIEVDGDEIVENGWEGRRLSIGSVALDVTGPSPRCVMVTLPQLGLPRDRGILQTVAKHNRVPFMGLGDWACLGAYATVVTPGEVAVGDAVVLLDQ
ncbi:MAG: hypothetical protein JWN67_949 [Actinomycetia bacterium]|nr:hypothetical protein [Actinomycetes bacterium]